MTAALHITPGCISSAHPAVWLAQCWKGVY